MIRRSRRFIQIFAISYSLVCVALYFQQQRLMFFPSRQLKLTPAQKQLEYQDVWIAIAKEKGESESIHGWWIEAEQPC